MKKTMNIKKLALLALAMVMLLCVSALGDARAEDVDITTDTDLPVSTPAPPLPTPKPVMTISGLGEVRGGSNVTLRVYVDGEHVPSSDLVWAVYPNNPKLCTVSQGTVKTKRVSYPQSVQVSAALKSDNSVYANFVITIRPEVSKLRIQASSKYIDLSGSGTLKLRAVVEPELTVPAVEWTSSSPSVASVNGSGLVTGHKTGRVVITAKAQDGSGKSDSITLQVVNGVSGLEIMGPSIMTEGASILLTAVAQPDNASVKDVVWSVDCEDVIAVISKEGRLTAKKVEDRTVVIVTAASAQNPDVKAYHEVVIRPAVDKITVTAMQEYIDLGEEPTLQLYAKTQPDDAATRVSWSSSNNSVASVDVNGLVTGKREGRVTITARATDGSGTTGKITLDVIHAVHRIEISGPETVAAGQSITLTAKVVPEDASNPKITWSVDCHSSIATISSNGRLTAKSGITEVYTVTVTATSKENPEITGTFDVLVRPVTSKVEIYAPTKLIDVTYGPQIMQLTAVCTPADANQQVEWTSSDEDVATVDANGLVTAAKEGRVTITATAADGSRKSDRVTLDVVKAVRGVTIEGANEVASGSSITLKAVVLPEDASNQRVTWSVDCDEAIATISRTGKLTAKSGITEVYTVTVTATSEENPEMTGTYPVFVRPAVENVIIEADRNYIDFSQEDKTLQLTAICQPDTAIADVEWSSSSPSIASVDANGLVTAKAIGSTSITARAKDGSGKMNRITVKVLRAVHGVVIEGGSEVASGKSLTLKAYVMPEDATNQDVTWSIDCSSDVATVSNEGRVKTGSGLTERVTVNVTATSKGNPALSATHAVTICPVATSVKISETRVTIDFGVPEQRTYQLSATVLPADASQQVAWSSSRPSVVSVDENGLLTAKATGTASIVAKAKDGSGETARISVTVANLVKGIEIKGSDSVAFGKRITLKAIMQPANATNSRVTWSIDCPTTVATIDEYGRVRAKSSVKEITEVTVTATSKENPDIKASVTVTLRPAVTKVTIEAPVKVIDLAAEAKTLHLTAVCTPDNAGRQVKWTSSRESVATVDENGVVTGLKKGSTIITAEAMDGTERKTTITIKVVESEPAE